MANAHSDFVSTLLHRVIIRESGDNIVVDLNMLNPQSRRGGGPVSRVDERLSCAQPFFELSSGFVAPHKPVDPLRSQGPDRIRGMAFAPLFVDYKRKFRVGFDHN